MKIHPSIELRLMRLQTWISMHKDSTGTLQLAKVAAEW